MFVARLSRLGPFGHILPRTWRAGAQSSIGLLLLGLLVTAFVSATLVVGFLIRNADIDANRLAATTITGAVDRERSRISNETFINAHWNEAARHVYGVIDARWVDSNYGTPIARNYIIDARGATLFGHLPGGHVPPLHRMISAETLRDLLARVPGTEAVVRNRKDAIVLLAKFGGTPALVGFSPIVRETGPALHDRRSFRIFVDIRLLDDGILREWSKGFSLPNLRWVPPTGAQQSDPSTGLIDVRGHVIGTVAWSRLTPGMNAFRAMLPLIASCILLSLVISAALIRRALRLSTDLEAKTKIAEDAASAQHAARLAAEAALVDARQARRESEDQAQRRVIAEGRHRAEMTTASCTIADRLQETIGSLIENLRTSASELDVSADRTLATIVDQQKQAETAHLISTHTSALTCDMLDRLRSIAATVDLVNAKARHSAEMMIEAARCSATAQGANEKLTRSVASIQQASEHIDGISQATKLLALNATMEAARAGDMGRGFAVVAHEVKSFSQQAENTARDIAARVHDIGEATNSAVTVSSALVSALESVTSSANQTIEMTEQQHSTHAELQTMIVTVETATGDARSALDSLDGTFAQTAALAHRTRLIGLDMRGRTEMLQRECDRIVSLLRNADPIPVRGENARSI